MECELGTVQRSIDAAAKDALTKAKQEECARGMGQRSNDVAMQDAHKARKGGVCFRHGAKRKLCRCSIDECTNGVVKREVCIRHGGKVKLRSSEGCTNQAKK